MRTHPARTALVPFISEFVERWRLRSPRFTDDEGVRDRDVWPCRIRQEPWGGRSFSMWRSRFSIAIVLLSLQRRIESGWQWQGASPCRCRARGVHWQGAFPILIVTVPFPALLNAGAPAAILCLLFAGHGVRRSSLLEHRSGFGATVFKRIAERWLGPSPRRGSMPKSPGRSESAR